MFQDYTSKVIKSLRTFSRDLPVKSTLLSLSGVNAAQAYCTGGVSGVAIQVEYDSNNSNVIMSFDGSLVAPSGSDFVAFVHTYVASEPFVGEIFPTTNISIIPFFNIQGTGYFQGNVVVPKLQLSADETQYVVVGVASPTDKASPVSMYLDMKLHLQDQQVFQPSK